MAQVKFSDVNTNEQYSNTSQVGFFGLKNDNDEAIVRFMHDSTDSFDILTVHNIAINGKYRKVNCIRDPHEPIEKCPLCQNGTQIQQRLFIHLIQYIKDERGIIVPVPKVWERSMQYASTLKSFIDNYGPLSDMLFKVVRHGAAGNMKTTYEILPIMNKTVYRDDIYVKNAEAFNDYKVLGSIVMDKDYSELNSYITTGVFPDKSNNNYSQPMSQYNNPYAAQNYETNTPTPVVTPYSNDNNYTRVSPWQNVSSTPSAVTSPYRQY